MSRSGRTTRRASRFASVAEAERLAARRLPRWLFDGLTSGSGSLVTAHANIHAFDATGFVPRAAVSIGTPDISTTILGRRVDLPVLIAPTGYTRMFHPEGDCAVASATNAAGSIDLVAWDSGRTLEEVAESAPGARLWQQVYWLRGRDGAADVIDRASTAGYEALVVTIDLAVSARNEVVLAPRRRSLPLPAFGPDLLLRYGPGALRHPGWLSGFLLDKTLIALYQSRAGGAGYTAMGTQQAQDHFSPSWEDLEWIRQAWEGPLVLKGILSVDDARRAVDLGAQAIVVSNHGGKGLDTQPATMRVLPEIVDAVGDDIEVYLDSGVRRGSDVVKALSVGARAVLIGQAYLFGLAVAGEAGVTRILEILAEEIRRTMILIGAERVAELDRSRISLEGSPAD
jgi:isopentenyl diphosphate isomerase/L-lactate dehydrogenase-like FMN-dependent dehydrogenase